MNRAVWMAFTAGCAPWVFRTIGAECDGVERVTVTSFDHVHVRHALLADGPVPREDSCYIDAEGERAPVVSTDATMATVVGATEVDIYGVQDLQVEWLEETGASIVENDLGSVRGRGSAAIGFRTEGEGIEVDITCEDCAVDLLVPATVHLEQITARQVTLCLAETDQPMTEILEAVANSERSVVVGPEAVAVDGALRPRRADDDLEALCEAWSR